MRQSLENKLSPRQRILAAAEDLFFHEGIRRVTMEAVAAKANTTKMTIYRQFESKEALVAEWLAIVTADYASVLDKLEADFPEDPRAQLLGWVRHIADGLAEASYRGCPFINTLAEVPRHDDPARLQIQAHKDRQAKRIEALCKAAKIPNPIIAAAELTFLLEGAQVSTQNKSSANIGKHLLTIGTTIVDRGKPTKTRVASPKPPKV